jgi:hypothetical protein
MMSTDNQKFLILELTALAVYLGATVEDQRVEMYAQDLAEYDLQKVVQTLRTFRRTATFFPKMAEILELLEGTDQDEATRAWYRLRNLKGPRAFQVEELNNAISYRCFLEMGGPEFFGTWDFQTEDFKIKRFVELYKLHKRELRANAALAIEWIEGDAQAKKTLDRLLAPPNPPLGPRRLPEERPEELKTLLSGLGYERTPESRGDG